jgi:hypothetical protein
MSDAFAQKEGVTSVTHEPATPHWLQTRFAPDDAHVPIYCGEEFLRFSKGTTYRETTSFA